MSEQIQTEGLSLTNIFKLFLSKIKLLIIVLICGVIAGGAFGLIRSNGVNYYGTRLEFYINPETSDDSVNSESTYGVYGAYGKHVMDNMIKLLSSEIFAEKLILNGEHLPEKDKWVDTSSETEVALDLNTKIDAAQVEVDKYDTAYAELQVLIQDKNDDNLAYNTAYEAMKEAWQTLYNQNIVDSPSFNQREYNNKSNANPDAFVDFSNKLVAYQDADKALTISTEAVKEAQASLVTKRDNRDKVLNIALSAWRKTEAYRGALYQYREAVSFSYIEETAKTEDAADLARSFIYVNINVLGDGNKAFAEDLMARIQVLVPAYVSENMIIPTGYSGTRCIEITTTSGIALTNPTYMKDSIIKFALLGGAAALVLACVILVIVDSSDKRVRSYEQIDRYLKVPLLGIIPSIDEDKINAWHENMKNGKGDEQL